MLSETITKYRTWKIDIPCIDRQYDEIGEFLAGLSHCELREIMEDLDSNSILPVEHNGGVD